MCIMGILISTLEEFLPTVGRFLTRKYIQYLRESSEELEDLGRKYKHRYEFSDIHGVNIHLDPKEESASWVNERHGGIGVVKPPLGVGESMQLKVTGSGAFAIGIFNVRWLPHVVSDERFRNWSYWLPALTNDNQNMTVTIQRIAVQEFQIVESSRVYTQQLDEDCVGMNTDFIVVVDIYYGEVKLQIQKESASLLKRLKSRYSSHQFASESENVKLSSWENSIRLHNPHPWTLILVQGPLYQMSEMHIFCDALDDSDTSFVKVFLTNDPPHDLFLDHSAENSMVKMCKFAVENKCLCTVKVMSSVSFWIVDVLPETAEEKFVHIIWSGASDPYRSRECYACLDDLDLSRPVYVCLKMFKVKVQLSRTIYTGLSTSPYILQRPARPGPPPPPIILPRRQPRGDNRVRQNVRTKQKQNRKNKNVARE